MVREGQALGSVAVKDRLSTGAIIEEIKLVNERLHYRLVTGLGPKEGWVSIRVSGKDLVVREEEKADENPKKRFEAASQAKHQAVDAEPPAKPGKAAAPKADGLWRQQSSAEKSLEGRILADARTKSRNGDLSRFCLKYKLLGYPLPDCKLRAVCFHGAGTTEANFTSAGTPFLAWAKETKAVEICALDFPGRNRLVNTKKHTSIDTLAPELLAVMHEKLSDGVPYVVWAHSVGTWVAFEFLVLARRLGLPMPKAGFFMAFPAPHLPESERPWPRSVTLDDSQLRDELMNWDMDHFGGAGKVAFESEWTGTWEPLLRADFRLFDEYQFRHFDAPRFDFPIHAWHFDGEHYSQPEMIWMWRDWTNAEFESRVMEGMGHLTCFYKTDLKRRYFEAVTELMKGHAGL